MVPRWTLRSAHVLVHVLQHADLCTVLMQDIFNWVIGTGKDSGAKGKKKDRTKVSVPQICIQF